MNIRTNNIPRFTIGAYELSPAEQEEFDYLDWDAIEAGSDSATFFRFKGQLYDLGEFLLTGQFVAGFPNGWDGYYSDSYFSGTLVRFTDNGERVVVGQYFS